MSKYVLKLIWNRSQDIKLNIQNKSYNDEKYWNQ